MGSAGDLCSLGRSSVKMAPFRRRCFSSDILLGDSSEMDSGDRAPVIAQELVDRLADHKTLRGAPRSELEWLAAHGVLRRLTTGEVLSVKGVQVEALYIILSGRLALFVDRGAAD